LSKVKEVFIDATHNVSKEHAQLYAIIADELSSGIPIGFMMMDVGRGVERAPHRLERLASTCNQHFFQQAAELGLKPKLVHTDRDFGEITPAKVQTLST